MSRRRSKAGARSRTAAAAEEEGQGRESPSFGRRVWEQVSTLAIAVAVALVIRAFVIEPFRIPSGSMLPTLLIGDHLFVNKFVYGVRVPFTELRLPGLRDPGRGDVVVFNVARGDGRSSPRIVPADRRPDLPRDDFVKRIVGLPGDRVSVHEGRVWVNGERVAMEEVGEIFVDEAGRDLTALREHLDGCTHAILDDPAQAGLERSVFTVEPGRYFVMGDNRDHSNDSRRWGTVRLEEIKGPAFILYWSWDVKGNFLEFLNPVNWFTAEIRWSRIFQRVKCEVPERIEGS